MAVLKSKQLNPNLTGSFVLSGSSQTLHGTTTIHGTTTVSGSLILKGPSVDLNIRQDDNTNIARLLTTTGGESSLKLYDNANHGSAVETININTSDAAALTIKSGSSTIFTVDRDNALISGSSTSTGSFGRVETAGNINASGNVRGSRFEIDGSTDYIDQAFGSLFIVTTGDIAAQPGTNKALKVTGGISATSHITASGNLEAAGNISGSVTSTGSFGSLVVDDKVQGDLTIGNSLISNKGATFNAAQSSAHDFRALSANKNYMLYVDANKDKVGIGFQNPEGNQLSSSLHIAGDLMTDSHITGSGNINTTAGRVYEQGTSVIDHATAMAIVFGG